MINRHFEHEVSDREPLESHRSQDNTFLCFAIPKAEPGQHWRRLFRGDSDAARCMKQPYTLKETADDVLMEFEAICLHLFYFI